MKLRSNLLLGLLASAPALTLVACGGGGGATSVPLTVSGVAAIGLALDNASVSVRCASGTPSATVTGSDGGYKVDVSDGAAPCLVTVTKGTLTLNAVTSTNVANVTPISDAIVKAVAQAKGAGTNLVNLVTPGTSATVTATDLTVAQTVVRAVLQQSAGITLPAGDLITSPLVAATPGNPNAGNDFDRALDALKANGTVTATGTLAATVQQTISNATAEVVKPTGTGG